MERTSPIFVCFIFAVLIVGTAAGQSRLDSLRQLYQSHEQIDTFKVDVLNKFARRFYWTVPPMPDSGIIHARNAIHLSAQIQYPKGRATGYFTMAAMYFAKRDYDQAVAHYKQSAAIYQSMDDLKNYARALKEAGYAAMIKPDYSTGLSLMKQSFEISESINDFHGMANTYTHIGTAYTQLGDYSQALQYLLQASLFQEKLGKTKGLSNCYTKLSTLYSEVGSYEEAFEYSRKSLAINTEIGNTRGKAIDHECLANLFTRNTNYDLALVHMDSAFGYNKEMATKEGMAANLNRMGSILFEMQDYSSAYLKAKQGLTLRQEIGANKAALVYSLYTMAEIYQALDSTQLAIRLATNALDQSQKLRLRSYIAKSSSLLWKLYAKQRDYPKAFETLEIHLAYKDSLFNDDLAKEIGRIEVQQELSRVASETRAQKQQIEILERDQEIKRLWVIILVSGVLLALIVAFFFFYRLRLKNRAHLRLQATQAQLVQSEKMVSLGQLTAGIAHEINNPMNFVTAGVFSISEYLEELKDANGNGSETAETIKEIDQLLQSVQRGVDRTINIVNHLRTYSRLDQNNVKGYDFHENLESTLVLLQSKITPNIQVHLDIAEVDEFYAFPGKLNQVFTNLISNSVDAIGDQSNGKIIVAVTQDENLVHILVSDNGKGIAKGQLSKIFDPFYTTKPVGSGTGLGLSICKTIIEEHKGSITAHSEPGLGTTFTIILNRHLEWTKDLVKLDFENR